MKNLLAIVLVSFCCNSCKIFDPAPKQCRIVSVKEELKFFLNDVVTLSNTTLKYDEQGDIKNMEVNSSSSNRRATYSLNVSTLLSNEKLFEYRYSDGFVSRDTISFNAQGYRQQIKRGISRGLQTIIQYTYDANGYPAGIKQVDQFGKVYTENKWIVEKGNLVRFQVLKEGVFEDSETYVYDTKQENDRLYYINNFQNAYSFGRAPKKILLKVSRTGLEYEYGNYQYDANGNVTSYIENRTPSFDIPSTRKVSLVYETCK